MPPVAAAYQLQVFPPVAGVPVTFTAPKPQTEPPVVAGADRGIAVTFVAARKLAQPFSVCSA